MAVIINKLNTFPEDKTKFLAQASVGLDGTSKDLLNTNVSIRHPFKLITISF